MQNKEIENLQARLNKLKEKQQPQRPVGIGQQFEEMGKTFGGIRDVIPKIKIGKDKPDKNYVDDPFVVKMKRWLLIGLTVLIGGGALIMVGINIIKRVF